MSDLFAISKTKIERRIEECRKAFLQRFVNNNLGLRHINRGDIIANTIEIAKALLIEYEEDPLILIFDGTYIFHEKSGNFRFQRNTYSGQKKRQLWKPLLCVTSVCYILEAFGPYPAHVNDVSIMQHVFSNSENRSIFAEGDILVLDRGFRDIRRPLEASRLKVYMPACVPGNRQLSW